MNEDIDVGTRRKRGWGGGIYLGNLIVVCSMYVCMYARESDEIWRC